MNIPPYGDSYKRVGAYFSNLQVSAKTVPNLTVQISAGCYWYYSSAGAVYVEYVGGYSPTMSAPTSGNAKWVIIAIGPSGTISLIDGSEATHPDLPVLPGRGRTPLAAIYIQSGSTSITNDMIFDVRPLFPLEVRDHRDLEGNTSAGSHPISAISNLTETIADLATTADLIAGLALKADQTGTNETSFILNKDYIGVPSSDCLFEVERGSLDNVGLKWNEGGVNGTWQYTDDGTTWINLSDFFLNDGSQDIMIQTYSQDTEPVLTVGTAAIWIDTNSTPDNKTYFVYCRGTGDQLHSELTSF